MQPIKVILDTDIGPDCDDAAALALVHLFAADGLLDPLAVTHCTSSPYGVGAIRAINRWYGRPELPVGTLSDTDLLIGDPRYETYNKPLAESLPEVLRAAPDATALLRETLAGQPDGSVTLVAIGPLRNVANLMDSGPDAASPLTGAALMERKITRMVLMGGCFPDAEGQRPITDAEWNFLMDIPSAHRVVSWPGEIVFCGFEVGFPVISGGRMAQDLPENHPVRQAYALHGSDKGRNSWDLLTVLWAAQPDTPLMACSQPGTVSMDAAGITTFAPTAEGRHRFLRLAQSSEAVAGALDALLARDVHDGREKY